MIHQADKYYTQQHGPELEQAPGPVSPLPVLPIRPGSPDDYHSAREPSEFEYNSDETDDPKDDGDDTSACSDSTN